MSDLLVPLYDLWDVGRAAPPPAPGVRVRPAMGYEKHHIVGWVRNAFGEGWASEADVAFANRPISCFVATKDGELQGFACYDATCRGFFGPLGVAEGARGAGIGKKLLLACLQAMACVGYAYAVMGGVDSPEFYVKAVGAIEIPGSTPGIYRDRLR